MIVSAEFSKLSFRSILSSINPGINRRIFRIYKQSYFIVFFEF
ncbi:hypothetical protein LEP1GSC192_2110 [Leptospira sp. B5-022]|nr:hypothetical protein LEP1GSC192_2110 [Leptospira sp. B5-022]